MIGRSVQFDAFGRGAVDALEGAYGLATAANEAKTIKKMAKYGVSPASPVNSSGPNFKGLVDGLSPVVSRFAGDLFARGRASGLDAFNAYASGSASNSPLLVPGVGNIYKGVFG